MVAELVFVEPVVDGDTCEAGSSVGRNCLMEGMQTQQLRPLLSP